MRLVIEGHHLPGTTCGQYADVHVGVPDFRGPAVHGRRGERFVYLTWGEGRGSDFAMFRRAKLMLGDIPDPKAPAVLARIHLTDEHGHARCARLDPPALEWKSLEAERTSD